MSQQETSSKQKHIKKGKIVMLRQRTYLQTGLMLILGLCLIVSLSACESKPREIRIGVIAPLTGDYAEVGALAKSTAEMAVQEVNDAGGLEIGKRKYTVVLVVEDNQSTPEGSTSAARKLINQENVVAIVGPQFSSNAIPAANVAEGAGVPIIFPISTNPDATAGKQFAFRVPFIDPFQGEVLARVAIEDLQAQKVAVLYDVANAYSKGLAEVFKRVFEEAGGQVVAFEIYTIDQQDLTPQMTRIRDSEATVLFLPNVATDLPAQIELASELGIEATFIGGDSWDLVDFTGLEDKVEGAFYGFGFSPEMANEKTAAFSEAYKQAYGQEPGGVELFNYDAFGILFQALQSQDEVNAESVRNGLASLGRYTGVTGITEFRGSGDPVRGLVIKQFQGDKFAFYKVVNP